MRKWLALAAAVTAATACAGLAVVAWIASERAIHPAVASYPRGLAAFPNLHPIEVGFGGRVQARIAGWFFRGARRATVVLSHGYGDNRVQMLPYADFLVRRGFSVLTYDMRSRGRSTGDAVTMGSLETMDIVSAVDYLVTRPDVDRGRIGALGLSLGGAATILAAAQDERIRAVVDDSGFSDAPAAIRSSFEHFIGLPPFPFAPLTATVFRLRTGGTACPTGVDVNRVRPVDAIARISPRPVLIVHCQSDQTVPSDNSERNFAAAGAPKQFWRIPRCSHVGGFDIAEREYEGRVGGFFEQSLR